LLQEHGLSAQDAHSAVEAARPVHDLARVRAGETLTVVRRSADGAFWGLVYPVDRFRERTVVVLRWRDEFVAALAKRDLEIQPLAVGGLVTDSLWATCESMGFSADNILALAGVFEWEFDFNTQVQEGDTFRVVIQDIRDRHTGQRLRLGEILAAEYVGQEGRMFAVRYEDSAHEASWYDEAGMSTKKMFLKSPLAFDRISSGFSRKRWHPVLKTWRAHNGIDYAAGSGTPVRAIGRGKVSFAGTKGGYGKHVRLAHNKTYASSYSHLSRIAVKSGQSVEQGALVGYVGSTGLATGPHLHFEFYVNGSYSNFLAQKFPRTEPIAEAERPAFEAERKRWTPVLLGVAVPGGRPSQLTMPGMPGTPAGAGAAGSPSAAAAAPAPAPMPAVAPGAAAAPR
jgi:murein DD-endopeptidase MepM/ murein hydrolase activator NlpD